MKTRSPSTSHRGRKGRTTETRPTKICEACGRAFTWRRKWARCWEEVRFCSQRCRSSHPKPENGNS